MAITWLPDKWCVSSPHCWSQWCQPLNSNHRYWIWDLNFHESPWITWILNDNEWEYGSNWTRITIIKFEILWLLLKLNKILIELESQIINDNLWLSNWTWITRRIIELVRSNMISWIVISYLDRGEFHYHSLFTQLAYAVSYRYLYYYG